MTHESIHAEPDPPWSPTNFRQRFIARRQRIARAGQKQAEKVAALQAQQINIEQIEALERVVQPEPEVELVRPIRREYETRNHPSIYISLSQRILQAVANEFEMTVAEVTMRCNANKYCIPRFVVIGLLLDMTQLSLPGIGRVLKRDHTTILSGKRRLAEMLNGEAFRNRYERIKAGLL